MLEKIDREIRVLRPKQTILAASFVYFCHEENAYMNAHIKPRRGRARAPYKKTGHPQFSFFTRVTMWEPETELGFRGVALLRYGSDCRRSLENPVKVRTSSVTLDELVEAAESFTRALRGSNSRILLTRLASVLIRIDDLEITVEMDLRGIRRVRDQKRRKCDISLSSRALLYCFRFPWGGETLFINGRFRVPEGGDYYKFSRWFSIAQANNRGTYYNRKYYLSRAIRRRTGMITGPRRERAAT